MRANLNCVDGSAGFALPRAGCGRRTKARRAWAFGCCLAMVLACGCGETPKSKPKSSGKAAGEGGPAGSASECERITTSLISLFDLQRLNGRQLLDNAASQLVLWQRTCVGLAPADADGAMRSALKPLLPDALRDEVLRPNLNYEDLLHLRSAVLSRAILAHAIKDAQGKPALDDEERVARLFQYVVHNVDLLENTPDDLPLTDWDVLLLGMGAAEHRAWVFTNLVRQLKLDTVLLYPHGAVKPGEPIGKGTPFLVGVAVGGDLLLYDVRLGLPVQINDAEDRPVPWRAARWSELRAAAETLDAAAEGRPAEWNAIALDPRVLLAGNATVWSPRAVPLQAVFAGEHAAVVSDPLVSSDGKSGAVARLKPRVEAWAPGRSLGVWSFPDQQVAGTGKLSALLQQTYERLVDVWRAPIMREVRKGESGETMLGTLGPTHMFLKARIQQLNGQYDDAVSTYVVVQLTRKIPGVNPDARMIELQRRAAEEGGYQVGVARFLQNDYPQAREKFEQYLRTYPQGSRAAACRRFLALMAASARDFPGAVAELEKIPDDHPSAAGNRLLIRRWQRLARP